jgi:cytochrome c oxidase assembly protein subunit 11
MSENSTLRRENRNLSRQLWIFAIGAFGFGFALVPLYSVICSVTQYGDRSLLSKASAATITTEPDLARNVTVELISGVPTVGEWEFHPVKNEVVVHPGQLSEADFIATNMSSQATIAQAVPSIAPGSAVRFFHKTECFCFKPQPFEGKQTRKLVVRFIVDPQLPAATDRLTLAYSMFTVPQQVAQK